ncbi:MAG: HDIG domain-containing protein [Phycisphaerales bacterium]|nr:HDIG domain-containing protein [Phycisphaerales bacterium]
MWFRKTSPRRQAIREDVAESESLAPAQCSRRVQVILIVAVFFLVACLVQFWPGPIAPYYVGQTAPVTLRSPVSFTLVDEAKTANLREGARAVSPPVLVPEPTGADHVISMLIAFRQDLLDATTVADVPAHIKDALPSLTDSALRQIQNVDPTGYGTVVRTFVPGEFNKVPFISQEDFDALPRHPPPLTSPPSECAIMTVPGSVEENLLIEPISSVHVIGQPATPQQLARLKTLAAKDLGQGMGETIAHYMAAAMNHPTHAFSPKYSQTLAELRATEIPPSGQFVAENAIIIEAGKPITAETLRILDAAQETLQQQVLAGAAPWARWSHWLSALGRILTVLLITMIGAFYVIRINAAAVANGGGGGRSARTLRQGWTICGLLLVALILARALVGHWPQSAYISGIAPTLFAAIILVITYSQRFALVMASLHGLLVAVTLGLGIDFYLALLAGASVYCFGLVEIRTRSKLIEIGAFAGAAIFLTIWALGLTHLIGLVWNPWIVPTAVPVLFEQSLWGAGGGILVATIMWATLSYVERIFNISTATTLLELCDANRPLLRRLQQEAPGTFSHSLTVGIMAEAAGNAIGANGLLCRVGAYYHDVGKLSKPHYFIENQTGGSPNRHEKLSPAMSLLIIVGHVKDGIELAREYGLPSVVHPFIAQHHGTTLVEYFYHAAKKRQEQEAGDSPVVSESEFRYPGPKPQIRETAIVMICDTCESVVRSIEEPTAGRIETAVHDMIRKRLMDGQFDQCDLTLRDLATIEQALIRTLAGIYHGRIAYAAPSETSPPPPFQPVSQSA